MAQQIHSVFRDELFNGRVALVTGGGSGIGFRTALELSYLGCTVVISARKKDRLDEAARIINNFLSTTTSKGKVLSIPMNVRSEESRNECITKILEITGKIDYLVNNAGGQFPTPAEHCSKKGWDAVIDLNLTALFMLSREVLTRTFKENHFGVIVNVIADMWRGFPGMVHTGAARAAVHNLTQTLGVEWAKYGVRVVSVAPGTIDSTGLNSYGPGMREVLEESKKLNYAYRFGTVEEVSASIVFLLSPASSFTTGTTLRVDGGGSLFNGLLLPTEPEKIHKYEDELTLSSNLIKSNL